jgi:hypothetical protein
MLRRLALVLFCGWFGVISVHANSIALSDTRSPGNHATRWPAQTREPQPILSLAWVPRSNRRQQWIPDRIHFCGRPCSATTEFSVRVPGIVMPVVGEFIPVSAGRDAGIGGWVVHFLRREFGGRVSHKMCKASGTC